LLVRDPAVRRKIPNAITVARLVLAAIFFGMLRFYEHGTVQMAWWLFTAGWLYGLAAASDWVDGHLARKWQVQSAFGRIVDPFCDKILILGTFVFFASEVFVSQVEPSRGENLTGVGPVAVVLLLGRELLVTTIRSLSEGEGQAMGAKWIGKFKMTFQSIAIPIVILYVFSRAWLDRGDTFEIAIRILRDVAVWGTVIVTLWSAWEYLPRRRRSSEVKELGS
jgi:CDP-diacylglycerol--glycerol-3-phosphate 3-phosphatidyltransferase